MDKKQKYGKGFQCFEERFTERMNLDKIAQAVKTGSCHGRRYTDHFPAIAVCDGIAMGHNGMKYSLVTRDLIADSTEAMAIAHQFDALGNGAEL